MSGSIRQITESCRRPRPLLLLLAVLVIGTAPSPGQVHSAQPNSSIEAHFAAAKKAQLENDYATAQREYSSVVTMAPNFAEAHMNLGLVHQLQHHESEAMAEFTRALKIKPSLTGANFFLGVDYCNLGQGPTAVPYLKAAVKADPDRVDPWSWLATAQELSNDLPGELDTLDRALKLHPQNMDLLYQSGHVYERLGKQEADRLGKLRADSFRSEQLLAESYASSSEWPSAVIHFENAITAAPEARGLHVELGEVLLQAAQTRRAAEEFAKELAKNPHSLRALVRRGEVKLIDGDVDGALQDWTQAIAVDQQQTEKILGLLVSGLTDSPATQLSDEIRPKLEQAATHLSTAQTPAGRLASAFVQSEVRPDAQPTLDLTKAPRQGNMIAAACAESAVRQYLEQERFTTVVDCASRVLSSMSAASLRLQIAAALLETGHYDLALSTLSRLSTAERQTREAAYWLARCYERLATRAYLQLYQLDPHSYRAHQLLGDLDAAKEEDKEAMVEYRAAIELKPTLPNLHYDLGHLLWKHLATDEARHELEAELALNPNHAGALNDLGDTYLLDQQPEKALPYLNRALTLDPENPQIHRDLGTAYSESGDFSKAARELLIALPQDRDGSIHFKLARAYQALGQKDKAKQEFALSEALSRESHTKLENQTRRLAGMSTQ